MRKVMVEQRVGEFLGPIDYNHPALAEHPEEAAALRTLEGNPDAYEATTDSGWPRFGWHPVAWVGMYDGWPWWAPYPTVATLGPLGLEHNSFYQITGIRERGPCRA